MDSAAISVVGAGPAGIALGVEADRAGISGTVIMEKRDYPCDTIVSLYRQGKQVDAVYRKIAVAPRGALSFTTTSRESFLNWMDAVIAEYGLDIRYGHEAVEVRRENGLFKVFCANGAVIEAPLAVIAIGIFGRPVKPSYKIPREISGHVYFSIPSDPPQDKNILVVGGGDSAAEAACFLSRMNRVTLSYRRSEFFRINEPNLCSINQCCRFENLNTRLGVDISGVSGYGNQISVGYGDGEQAVYDAVFYFLGGSTPRTFLEKCGVAYSGNNPLVDAYGETNIPGLFLAGDLAVEKGTIMTAFNSAAMVMQHISDVYADMFGI